MAYHILSQKGYSYQAESGQIQRPFLKTLPKPEKGLRNVVPVGARTTPSTRRSR